MDCKLVRINANLFICSQCGKGLSISERTPISKIHRTCQSSIPEPLLHVVFTEATDIGYKPWVIYTFTQTQLEMCQVKPEILLDDGLRVGTRFKSYLPGIKSEKCDCENLRQLLDAAPLPFIEKHLSQLSRRIKSSANRAGIPAPLRFIHLLLRRAIKVELRNHGR